MNHPPSTISGAGGSAQDGRALAPFERQPNENPKAFAAFSEYLRLGPNRTAREVAKKVGRSLKAIQMLSWRHHWVERTQAYETHMAQLQRETETAVLRDKAADWANRQHELREEEWKIHHECIETARIALHRFRQRRSKTASLSDIARFIELASRLGRLATGLPTDKTELTGAENGPIRLHLDFEAMLQKVYGQPIDAEVVQTATVPSVQNPALPLPVSGHICDS